MEDPPDASWLGVLDLVVSTMAPVVGAWLISAPLRDVLKLRRGLVATVNFLPLASIFLSSMVWVLYAYLTSDGMIFVCSAPGVLLGAFYLLSFYSFASDRGHPRIRWISLLTGFYTTAAYALASILEQNRAIGVVGTLGAAISVVLMASPLENIGRVLRDRSAESMNFSLTLAAFLNGALWTLKGTLLQYDPAVWIPNFLGALSGMVQLSLFAIFGSAKKGSRRRGQVSSIKDSWSDNSLESAASVERRWV